MEKKTVSGKSLMYFAISVLSPLFPVSVLIIFSHIAQAREVFFVSLALLLVTLWAWRGLWRSVQSQTIKIIGMVTGGAGAVLSLALVVCSWILFRTMS